MTSKKTNSKTTIPFDTKRALGFYVYALRDPRNGEVFYVGKGQDERILQHVAESGKNPKSEKAKLKRISQIESDGHQVEHLFLRTGIKSESEAFAIEQAVIDAFLANRATNHGVSKLTNLVSGHQHNELGLASLETVLARHKSEPTPEIKSPTLVLKLNRFWQPDMSGLSLLEASQGYWAVGKEVRDKAELAVVISFGVIRGVYEIDSAKWIKSTDPKFKGKWEFKGKVTTDPMLLALIGTDMGPQVKNQSSFQKFLTGFKPTK